MAAGTTREETTWSPVTKLEMVPSVQLVFSSPNTCALPQPAPAPLLLQQPARSCHLRVLGTDPGQLAFNFSRARADGAQRPCPDLQAQIWELKCPVQKPKSFCLL